MKMVPIPRRPERWRRRQPSTRNIVGSSIHEGYVPTPEAEAIHSQVARGEITSEEAIEIFRQRALELDRKISQAKSE